jgi:hypothetical protein
LKVDRDFQADKNGVQARSRADVAGRKAQSLILKLNDLRVFEHLQQANTFGCRSS